VTLNIPESDDDLRWMHSFEELYSGLGVSLLTLVPGFAVTGLCNPEKKLLLLHQQDACSKGPAEYKG
jgi:hypothetical protein